MYWINVPDVIDIGKAQEVRETKGKETQRKAQKGNKN